MKITNITLLSMSLSSVLYALERPELEEIESITKPVTSELDLSQVKPLSLEKKEKGSDIRALEPLEGEVPKEEKLSVVEEPTWLGVSGEPISETLREHLALNGGLVLRVVAEGSPAAEGGLKEHDVITAVNGRKITDQNILKEVIQSFSPGEEVRIDHISKGQRVTSSVTLISRPPQSHNTHSYPRFKNNLQEARPQKRDPFLEGDEAPRGRLRGLGGMLKEMGFNKLLKEADPHNSFHLDFKTTSMVKIHDEEGSVEVQILNGEKNVIVRDLDGKVQYEGPWNTEEDKSKTSEEIRKRVEGIDFNYKNHHLRFGHKDEVEMR